MASPVKPCCRSNPQNVNRNRPIPVRGLSNSLSAGIGRGQPSIAPTINPNERLPPPIPNRNAQLAATSTYGGYGSYNQYGMSNFGMYGSGMGRMGYGYGTTGPMNTFTRLAENSTRPAFESLEGIVNTFGSITMMLESTYFAVNSSFRAVVGLADHFSHLKHTLTDVLKNNVIRTFRNIIRRILVFLRLRNPVNETEEAWIDALNSGIAGDGSSSNKHGSSWPVLIFFLIVIGGPYLIWKLMSSIINEKEAEQWMTGNEDHFVAMADYEFDAMNEDEISFKSGQEIIIAPKELQPRMKGWLLGCVDGQKQGLIPGNYVRILGKRRGRKSRLQKSIPNKPSENTPSMIESIQQEESNADLNKSFEDVWIENEKTDNNQTKIDTKICSSGSLIPPNSESSFNPESTEAVIENTTE